jgi:uncharacterized protein (DUF433 family)
MASLETTQIAPLTLWEDGSIRIGSSRVTLDSVVREFTGGATAEQIQDDFPTLSLREIYGAIAYYLDHEDRVEEYLQRRDEEAVQVRRETEDRPRSDMLRRRIRERFMQAPKGPHVISRRFQPADRIAEQITPTPTGLTKPQSGPFRAGPSFRLIPWVFTHGYSRFAPSGQPAAAGNLAEEMYKFR